MKKLKADTDCRNSEFETSLKARRSSEQTNFKHSNIHYVHSLNTGRPLKPRIDVPDSVSTYGYGGQKLNIWEF